MILHIKQSILSGRIIYTTTLFVYYFPTLFVQIVIIS